jgi:hypothetical protein
MSKSTDKQLATAARLRRQLADAEAVVAQIKSRLAKVEGKIAGEPPTETGLDMLWKAALPTAKLRSSKLQCRQEWNRIPASERPQVQTAIDALLLWNRCYEWKKDGNQFVPGLHRWIKLRQWENIPDDVRPDPCARYRIPQKPQEPQQRTAEDEAALAEFLKFRPGRAGRQEDPSPKRMNS